VSTPAQPGVRTPVDPEDPEDGAIGGQDLLFEVDGPDVHPHNIDALVLLELAASFFSLVAAEAANRGAELRLDGLAVRDKCAAIVTRASDGPVARHAADQTRKILGGAIDPPKGAAAHVQRFRQAALRLDRSRYHIRAMGTTHDQVAWQVPIELPADVRTRPLDSWTTMRVRVERAGGANPAVRFSSVLEREDFTLRATEAAAQAIGKHLYKEGELEARIERGLDGEITGGHILAFTPLDPDVSDPWAPWTHWYQSVTRE
jgi:hypothetical protein